MFLTCCLLVSCVFITAFSTFLFYIADRLLTTHCLYTIYYGTLIHHRFVNQWQTTQKRKLCASVGRKRVVDSSSSWFCFRRFSNFEWEGRERPLLRVWSLFVVTRCENVASVPRTTSEVAFSQRSNDIFLCWCAPRRNTCGEVC